MLAQRFPGARINAIDIHDESVMQARENFGISPWKHKLSAQRISLQEFTLKSNRTFDLIVSNPPFFIDSLLPAEGLRQMAKHTESLSYDELTQCAAQLLKPDGAFAVILPFDKQEILVKTAEKCKLFVSRKVQITAVKGKNPNRVLLELTGEVRKVKIDHLFIRDDHGDLATDYLEFTKDFYLAS